VRIKFSVYKGLRIKTYLSFEMTGCVFFFFVNKKKRDGM